MRRFLIALLVLLGVVFFISRFTEVQQVVEIIQRGDLRWLGLGVFFHVAWLIFIALSFRYTYRLLGVEESIPRLMALAAAANFVNIVAPSGGMSGMAVLLADGRKRGHPSGRVTTGAALVVLNEQLSLLAIIVLGLIVLFRRNQINATEIIAAAILACIALIMMTLLYLGMRSTHLLERALAGIGRAINRVLRPILKRDYLDLEFARVFAEDVGEGLQLVRESPSGLILPALLGIGSKIMLIVILICVFVAFRQPFSPGTIIASFSIGYLFYIVSPTPSGIGFVEGAMTLVMRSLLVPLATAAVIALAYRGITFWLTLIYGMIAMRWVGLGEPAKPEEGEAPLISSGNSS